MSIRPNFFIVGAAKCGTTAWAQYLSAHPDICFARRKEPHFFNTDFPGFRWTRSRQEYLQHFSACTCERIVAEASVQYLYSVDAARNIANFCPEARVLIMLRSPSSFIRSYHNQLLLNLDENVGDLRTAWELSGQRTLTNIPAENREPAFLDYKRVGLFSEQVARYLDVFDRSKVMVVFMENWINDPRSLYLDLMGFLDIEDDGRKDFPPVHTAKNFSNRRLHQLTQRPPRAMTLAMSLLRRFPYMEKFKPVQLLRRINVKPGYFASDVDRSLASEIETYYAEDQAKLKQMLGQEK